MKPLTKIQKHLIYLRTRAGLTQEQAAKLIGCTTRTLQSWEQGTRTPKSYALNAAIVILKG